jgi:hypothetical protein
MRSSKDRGSFNSRAGVAVNQPASADQQSGCNFGTTGNDLQNSDAFVSKVVIETAEQKQKVCH